MPAIPMLTSRGLIAALVALPLTPYHAQGQIPDLGSRTELRSSDNPGRIGGLDAAYRSVQGDIFVTSECSSELLQDCVKLLARSIERRRALLLGRALRELHFSLLSLELPPETLVSSICLALALLEGSPGSCSGSNDRIDAILAGRTTWETTPHLGEIPVNWKLNEPQGIYGASETLKRLWFATRYLQLYPVMEAHPSWSSSLRIAFQRPELRDASCDLRELHLCLDDLWGRSEESTVWETGSQGPWLPTAVGEDALLLEWMERENEDVPEDGIWNLILKATITARGKRQCPGSIRDQILDLLTNWPNTLQEVPLLQSVEPSFWRDLDWHARGSLYLAIREADALLTSGPVTPRMGESTHVVVEPRPLLYQGIIDLMRTLGSMIERAESRGVPGLSSARRRIEESTRFVSLCLEWALDAQLDLRVAEREAAIVRMLRDGILAPSVAHEPSRLVFGEVGWMQREGYERVSLTASDDRKYTGVRTVIRCGK